MKNILLALNIILLALVGFLYYLHFNAHKPFPPHSSDKKDSFCNQKARVAYIDLDSLQANYVYYKKIKTEGDRKQEDATNELTAMQNRYQARAVQLQQKAQGMSQQEQEAAMREMQKLQQDLQERKQKLDNDLYTYSSKTKDDILNRLQNFLKVYNKDGKYDYILSYEPGFMFYKDSTLNITTDVISGLNDLYNKEKK